VARKLFELDTPTNTGNAPKENDLALEAVGFPSLPQMVSQASMFASRIGLGYER